ncbi:MAG: aspartate/glutamate racemase family protein [Acidobacteria bacterium]|nr:aspartate/glutamate racemase family protein [Acidobacteriota bacterium]
MAEPHRICYFVPGALSAHPDGASEAERRQAYLQRHVRAGVNVVLRDNPDGPTSVESAEDERRAAAAMLATFPSAVADDDAVIIGCFGDPGLREANALLDAPVIGPAAASLHLAAQLGSRIGLITVVADVIPILDDLVADYGLESRVRAITAVEVPVLELRKKRAAVLARMVERGGELADSGADVLVLGCMTMGFLDVAEELTEELGVPVVNPVLASLRTAEALLGLGRVKTLTTTG